LFRETEAALKWIQQVSHREPAEAPSALPAIR
jgi:hypothetical protein